MTSNARELAQIPSTPSGRRSIVTNGAMNVAQRGTSAVNASSSGTYRVDRFKGFASGGGVFTMEQSSTVPNNTFSNSTKLTVTTADSSIASGDYYAFNTDVEGYDIIRTAYGASDAQTLTLSFWVRSSVTGTYSVTAYNADGSRGYLNTFSIGSADTWTKVSLSWAGDTGGTWNKTNGRGITLRWDMGGGSSGHGTANQWTTSGTFAANSTSGSVQWIATNSATFYLTGVQLEVGSVATEFEHRSFGEELALCQRYFIRYPSLSDAATTMYYTLGMIHSSSVAYFTLTLPVPMRTQPDLSISGTDDFSSVDSGTIRALTNLTLLGDAFIDNKAVALQGAGTFPNEDRPSILRGDGTSGGNFAFDAEL